MVMKLPKFCPNCGIFIIIILLLISSFVYRYNGLSGTENKLA